MTDFIQDTELLESLKKLGFDAEVLFTESAVYSIIYHGEPNFSQGHTIEQVERWLWEKHTIHIGQEFEPSVLEFFTIAIDIRCGKEIYSDLSMTDPFTARLEGIRQAVKCLTEQKGVTQ